MHHSANKMIYSTPRYSYFCAILIFLNYAVSAKLHIIPNDKYNKLPPIHHLDDFDKCLQDPNNAYCHIRFKLDSANKTYPSETWQLIESMRKGYNFYKHDTLNYALCLPKTSENNDSLLSENFRRIAKSLNKSDHIDATVCKIKCEHSSQSIRFGYYDMVSFSVLFLWLALIVKYTLAKQNVLGNVEKAFSAQWNIRQAFKMYNENNKFKAIQSLRIFTMIFIVLCHTYSSYTAGFVEDPKYLEDFCIKPFKKELVTLFTFLVTVYFLLSGWLLAYKSFKIFESNPISWLKFFSLTILNRYLRLVPHVLFIVGLSMSSWVHPLFRGPLKSVYVDAEYWNCRQNWGATLLFVHNHYNKNKMCYPISWYLASDFQLYIISLILLLVLWKAKSFRKLIFAILVFGGVLVQAAVIYYYNLDVVYRLCGDNVKFNESLSYFPMSALYMATYANFASYMVGLAFGYAFYVLENEKVSNKINFILMSIFVTVPPLTIISAANQYPKAWAPIVGGLLKPLFAFGMGCGLFAMLKGYGGSIKTMFELKIFVFLGNITYSIYTFHYLPVFARTIISKTAFKLTDSVMIISSIQDVTVSLIFGFFIYITIEMPCSQLQNIFIPKISQRPKSKKKTI